MIAWPLRILLMHSVKWWRLNFDKLLLRSIWFPLKFSFLPAGWIDWRSFKSRWGQPLLTRSCFLRWVVYSKDIFVWQDPLWLVRSQALVRIVLGELRLRAVLASIFLFGRLLIHMLVRRARRSWYTSSVRLLVVMSGGMPLRASSKNILFCLQSVDFRCG